MQEISDKKENRLRVLFAAVLPLGVVIAFLHKSALDNYWYWLYWWTDIVMHYLGGGLVALFLLWFALGIGRFYNKLMETVPLFWFILLGTLVIGVGWEVFEYLAGFFITEEFFPDTLHDIFFDIVGASTIYLIYYKTRTLWVK